MPLRLEQDQKVVVAHRMNFWGQPSGPNTVSWKYRGNEHLFARPDDGSPPVRHSVRCGACKMALDYTVYSIRSGRRRQARLRFCAYIGLIAFLAGFVGLFMAEHAGPLGITLTLCGFFGGAVFGWVCGSAAASEMGIKGHGVSWPGPTKHNVTLVATRPDDMPELVCPRCGHKEETRWDAEIKESFLRKRYEAAKVRMDNHRCRPRRP